MCGCIHGTITKKKQSEPIQELEYIPIVEKPKYQTKHQVIAKMKANPTDRSYHY